MIHFEGLESWPLPPGEAYARLADAGWLAKALPGVEVAEAQPDRAAWKVRPQFAFMAGTLDTVAEVQNRVTGQQVRYRIVSKGVGSSSTADATLTIEHGTTGTTSIRWSTDLVELGGLLKMVPRGLLQAAAQKVITDVWTAIGKKVATSPVTS
jgi:carbon monoxide dehydrogenase subunit G